jgi:serine/threonine protein kinase/tetratricopeptide (TPR) repeat protein
MEHKNWQLVEELFHNALELSGEERASYLNQTCSGDPSLRAEVESLIRALEQKPDLIEQPALNFGLRVLAKSAAGDSLVGKVFGSYEILSLLGKGGMGEVYLAYDSRLDRKVALKFLSSSLIDDHWAKRRLVKEAQAIARLDHPNICAVYGLEESGGYSFIVMQYLDGETLASLIRTTMIEPGRVCGLAVQMVNALVEAHSHGIIHRDIKPQNIMVTASEQVKVLDFGLAKHLERKQSLLTAGDNESRSSQLGLIIGTVAYMSPEQLRSEKVDFRSDIFSFGIVLYEIISGVNPFTRSSSAETISAILTSDPDPPVSRAPGIPARLPHIARKCLEKDRERRYQSASELLLDLDNVRITGKPRSQALLRLAGRRGMALTITLLLIVVLAWILYFRTPAQAIAVLPLINESTEPSTEFLGKELTDGLVEQLSRLPDLRVQAPARVFGYSRRIDPREVGRDLGVDAVITWKITQRDGLLTLQTKLVNTADGSPMWAKTIDGAPTQILDLQDELVNEIALEVRRRLSGDYRDIFAGQTENNRALRHYRLGRYNWNTRDREKIRTAIEHFQNAVDLDPNFARAHAGLASCYVLLGNVGYGPGAPDAMARAKTAAETALRIDNRLSEAHTALGVVKLRFEWNWHEADLEFKQAISSDPDYSAAHYWYSNLLSLMGDTQRAIEESETARELSPSARSEINVARAFYYARDFDKAQEPASRLLKEDPANKQALHLLGLIRLQQQGKSDESIALLQRLYSVDKDYAAAPLGFALARAGRADEARRILEELSGRPEIPSQERAIIHIGLGDKDRAFELLQQAYDDHFAVLPYIRIEPLFDPIRDDPRFAELLGKVNLAP